MPVPMSDAIFIYRKGALGDTIAFLPFIFELKKHYANVIFAGNYLYRQLFEAIDFVNFLDADSRDVLSLFTGKKWLKAERYLIFSKPPVSYSDKNFLFYEPLPQKEWFYKHPFDCLKIPFREDRVYMPISYDKETDYIRGDKPFIVFHPGSGSKAKRWPLENFSTIELFIKENFNMDVLYLLGEAETELKNMLQTKKCLVNIELKKVISLLSHSSGYVGCDSGISHLAGILNLNGVVIFGPSSPDLYRPYGSLKVVRGVAKCVESVDVKKVMTILGEELEKGRNLYCL